MASLRLAVEEVIPEVGRVQAVGQLPLPGNLHLPADPPAAGGVGAWG
jgi:hypothetical protein